jgi:hypothetical protein
MPTQKHFILKGINQDDAPLVLTQDEALNMEEFHMGSTDEGTQMVLENIRATLSRQGSYTLPVGTNFCIGAKAFLEGKYVLWFVWNSNQDHRVLFYDEASGQNYTVLAGSMLGFSKYGYIHSIAIVNGIAYWTDDNQEPRRVNLAAAMLMNGSSPLPSTGWQWTSITDDYEINLVRRPPNVPPNITKNTDTDFKGSFIGADSFRFGLQFEYWDGEFSVISPWSRSSRYNDEVGVENRIQVEVPFAVVARESVRRLRLVVLVESTQKAFVVRSWDRLQDTAALDAHNQGIAQLTYSFYNDIQGQAIDDVTKTSLFHYVPIKNKTLEVIKNRLFLANNLDGYDIPLTTSLSVSQQVTDVALPSYDHNLINVNISATRYSFVPVGLGGSWVATAWYNYRAWQIYIQGVSGVVDGYYAITSTEAHTTTIADPGLVAPPGTVAFAGLTFRGATQAEVVNGLALPGTFVNPSPSLGVPPPGIKSIVNKSFATTTNICSITGITTTTLPMFKSFDRRQAGIVFYDRALRRCGVVTHGGLIFNIPPRNFALTTGVAALKWNLSGAGAINEIPDWAWYYAPLLQKPLRTRSLVQFYGGLLLYAKPLAGHEEDTSVWDSSVVTIENKTIGINISLVALHSAGLGYVFSEGDFVALYDDAGNFYTLPILRLSGAGTDLLVGKKDIGDLSSRKFIVEIYTPYKASTEEPFFEVGQTFEVLNPGTPSRQYSQLSGTFQPDAYIKSRVHGTETYFAEVMNPQDKFWKIWVFDHGKPNFIDPIGQRRVRTSLRFSAKYLDGTLTNGLSDFNPLDEEVLPVQMHSIQRIVNTSGEAGKGEVLLCLGEGRSSSVYVGEATLQSLKGTPYLVKSDGVIGSIQPLQDFMGTINPESVAVDSTGRVFWVDILNELVGSYAANGLFAVSKYKMSRALRQFARAYKQTSVATIEGFGSRPFIVGGVDGVHEEYLFTLPQLSINPQGTLGDPALPNLYDIWDGGGKTIAFKYTRDRFLGSRRFQPEAFAQMGRALFSFKAGQVFEHNKATTYNNYYGTPVRSRLMVVENGGPDSQMKVFKALYVEANQKPTYAHIRTEQPNVQSSDLVQEWKTKAGIFYAPILKDRMSPNASGTPEERMHAQKGDPMKGQWAKIMLEWDAHSLLQFRILDVHYIISAGHPL